MFTAVFAASFVALLSLSGVLLSSRRGYIAGMHRIWVPLSAGIFLGVIFFELIPETIFSAGEIGSLLVAFGFLSFFLLSHFLRREHDCTHDEQPSHRHTPIALLIGDGFHNIADGALLVSAFAISPELGLVTTAAIALHEIPQEIAEYSVLRNAGFSHKKALGYNFISALTVFLGVGLGQLFLNFGDALWVLTGFTAGTLLYIVTSSLLPELQDERHRGHFSTVFTSLLVGFVLMIGLITFSHQQLDEAGAGHDHAADMHLEDDHHEEDDHAH